MQAYQISGDESGLGGPICDRLAENGWPIRRVNNGATASKPDAYTNTGAEIWFEGRTAIEQGRIILPNDRALVSQLTTRFGWPDSKGRLAVEPKEKLRARGIGSPDRADAVLGAIFSPATSNGVLNQKAAEEFVRLNAPRPEDSNYGLRKWQYMRDPHESGTRIIFVQR